MSISNSLILFIMKNILKYSVFALVAVVACNKVDSPSVAPEYGDEIVFMTKAPATRGTGVSELTAANLTAFNVVATSGTTNQTLIWNDGAFTGTAGGDFTGGKYWPSESVSWNFVAANAPLTFGASGTTIAVANSDADIVAAYKAGATYKAKNLLTFGHILCQVGTVDMKAHDGYTVSDLKVSLTPIYGGTYNVNSGAWTRGSAAAAVYIVGSASAGVSIADGGTYHSADNDLWLVPGSYELTTTYTISKGDWSQTYTKHATVTLVQGQNNNLILPDTDGDGNNNDPNIPDPSDDVTDIIFTVEVTPWGDNDIPTNFS